MLKILKIDIEKQDGIAQSLCQIVFTNNSSFLFQKQTNHSKITNLVIIWATPEEEEENLIKKNGHQNLCNTQQNVSKNAPTIKRESLWKKH